jgi:hypothetical protein
MPKRKSLLTVIRDLVQQEVRSAIQSLVGSVSGRKRTTTGRRSRRRKARGTWRPGGPGRPPKAVAEKMARTRKATIRAEAKTVRRRRRRRRGSRPAGTKTKVA